MSKYTYRVYAIQLDHDPLHVYVGETSKELEARLAQHNTGLSVNFAARPFKRGARGNLRPDLYKHLKPVYSQAEANSLEAKFAKELIKKGYKVEGGH